MDKVNMCQIQKQIDNSKEEMMGVISFILAIFPLSFVINSYLVAMKNIGKIREQRIFERSFLCINIFNNWLNVYYNVHINQCNQN